MGSFQTVERLGKFTQGFPVSPTFQKFIGVKKTFFDSMLRLHPILRVPGYTLHKLGIALTGLPFRAR